MSYKNSKIYLIKSFKTDEVYVGSTIQSLARRLSNYKSTYITYLETNKNYISPYEIIKYDDCYIELLECLPCESRTELQRKQEEYIRNIKCVNKIITGMRLKENIRTKIICLCGSITTLGSRYRHIRSDIHKFKLSKIIQLNTNRFTNK